MGVLFRSEEQFSDVLASQGARRAFQASLAVSSLKVLFLDDGREHKQIGRELHAAGMGLTAVCQCCCDLAAIPGQDVDGALPAELADPGVAGMRDWAAMSTWSAWALTSRKGLLGSCEEDQGRTLWSCSVYAAPGSGEPEAQQYYRRGLKEVQGLGSGGGVETQSQLDQEFVEARGGLTLPWEVGAEVCLQGAVECLRPSCETRLVAWPACVAAIQGGQEHVEQKTPKSIQLHKVGTIY